jgi:hypothetical protein
MADKPADKGENRQGVEDEVWTAISAFEQILEAMPNDRASLEALSHAYEQIGDLTRSNEYLTRLGNVLLEEHDGPAATVVLDKMRARAEDDPSMQGLVGKLEDLSSESGGAGAAAAAPAGVAEAPKITLSRSDILSQGFNMSEEMSLAWNLREADQITEEEYASVVQDLSEMSAKESASTISVLHVLETRAFKGLERVLAFISKDCGAPIVTLDNFDLQYEAISLLPTEFMARRGVFVFELLGKDALVVIMNPYDKKLRKDIETLTERRCHFFMALPAELDASLEKTADILAEKAAAARDMPEVLE